MWNQKYKKIDKVIKIISHEISNINYNKNKICLRVIHPSHQFDF